MIVDGSLIGFNGSYQVALIRNIISEQLLDAANNITRMSNLPEPSELIMGGPLRLSMSVG